ncbi:ftsX-like permease family protein, partial [Vibrio parahaemolyticus EKP-028]
FTLNCG